MLWVLLPLFLLLISEYYKNLGYQVLHEWLFLAVALTPPIVLKGKMPGLLSLEGITYHQLNKSLRLSLKYRNIANRTVSNCTPILEKLDFACNIKPLVMKVEITRGGQAANITILDRKGREKGGWAEGLSDIVEFYKDFEQLADPSQYKELRGLYLCWATPTEYGKGIRQLPYKHMTILPPNSTNEVNFFDLYVINLPTEKGEYRPHLVMRIFSEYGVGPLCRICYALPLGNKNQIEITFCISISGEPLNKYVVEDKLIIDISILQKTETPKECSLKLSSEKGNMHQIEAIFKGDVIGGCRPWRLDKVL